MRSLGFSRISYGVQDLDPVVQEAIGRVQPETLVREAVSLAREEGFASLNLDLIYGLPHQTPERFMQTIEGALALDPDRVACFGYAHVPWIRAHQKRIDESALPLAGERFALFREAVDRFVDAGYRWIGIDHFARPEDPLALAADAGRLHQRAEHRDMADVERHVANISQPQGAQHQALHLNITLDAGVAV